MRGAEVSSRLWVLKVNELCRWLRGVEVQEAPQEAAWPISCLIYSSRVCCHTCFRFCACVR